MPDALPPLADPEALVRAMAKAHRRLADDLRARAADPRVEPSLRDAHAADRAQNRTGEAFETYREGFCDQVAASWVLCAVFARTLEDRGYLPHRLAGPGASDRLAQFRAQFRFLGERDYLLHIFDAIALLPGGREVFGVGHAPLWRLGPTSRAVGELLDELRAVDGRGVLRFSFGRPEGAEHDGASTRYLGDLYQDLNEGVRKRYALLQTPEFVERFLLENTLDPAIRERGIAVTVIDPACGSGHLLLGAYDRLFEARRRVEPGLPAEQSARTALGQVYGVDLNPYAAAVARFRLALSYLDKAGIPKLEQVPEPLDVRVYVGDSLLAGLGELQGSFGDVLAKRGEASVAGFERGPLLSFFDAEADKLLAKTRFDVVVANPPYITERDTTKRDLIRDRYVAASGKYALSAPFVERIFQLGNEGAFTGQITANSFMKREFGKALIEQVLSDLDLTEVIDTSGAYIPGHETPTLILFGRAQRKRLPRVRAVMGSRGEPTTPTIPAEGKVWSSIAAHHGEAGYADEFISVVEFDRAKFAQHPWSLGGGGAAELKELFEEHATGRLGDVADSIGISSFTLEDDVYMAPRFSHLSKGLRESDLRFLIEGDIVRDWSCGEASSVIFPYDKTLNPLLSPAQERQLWPWKTNVANSILFGGRTKVESGLRWFEFGRLTANKLRTPFSIAFAFVATHNHFVLDRGGKIFNRTAPIIKLSESATEEDHLALLGYLNSSAACFWMKQVMSSKGAGGVGGGYHTETWSHRMEFDGTKLQRLPLLEPQGRKLLERSREAACFGESSKPDVRRLLAGEIVAGAAFRLCLDNEIARCVRDRERQVALQEEIDWLISCSLFGLSSTEPLHAEELPGLRLGQRAFEILWARRLAKGESPPTDWYQRHGGVITTEPPASWPESYVRLVERRMRAIESSRDLQLIESADYKRRWSLRDYEVEIREALELWLYERTEAALHTPRPLSIRAVAHTLNADPKVRAVAEVLTGSNTYDLESLLGDLMAKEAVASAKCQRYTEAGLETHAAWERTWDLQRREDAGETLTIDVPPKYDQKDFENAASVWRLRGKLDVPKERFIAYPTASPPPGAAGSKAGLVFGWAGWTHLEQLQAAIELWQEELGLHSHELIPRATRREREESLAGAAAPADEALRLDAAAREKLFPILQTMVDLLPWVKQWHDEDGETADQFTAYVTEEAIKLEASLDEARAYRRPARAAGRARKAAPAEAPSTQLSLDMPRSKRGGPAPALATGEALDAAVEAVRALDQGAGVPLAPLGERLGLSAAALKKTVDALVEAGRLVERKKRPRMVSCGVEGAEP